MQEEHIKIDGAHYNNIGLGFHRHSDPDQNDFFNTICGSADKKKNQRAYLLHLKALQKI